MTLPTQLVLHACLQDPAQELYGLEICVGDTGSPSRGPKEPETLSPAPDDRRSHD